MMKPPSAGAAGSPVAGSVIIQNVNWDHRRAGGGCGLKRGIVGQSEVLSKPDNDGRVRIGHGCECMPSGTRDGVRLYGALYPLDQDATQSPQDQAPSGDAFS